MSQKVPTNKKNKQIRFGLPSGSYERPKSFFNFLPKQQQPLQDTGYDSDKTEIYETDHDEDDTNKENKRNFLIVDTSQFINQLETPKKTSEFSDDVPDTELKTYDGKNMYYIINDKIEPVTSGNYNRDMTIYDKDRNIIPPKEHLPENRIYYNDIMEEVITKGGKRMRKTLRKTKRKINRKKTRRYRRRHTRKYK